jgi:outer membrane protein assembly factor BamE (lipoprotein component of BamABCDE complex)
MTARRISGFGIVLLGAAFCLWYYLYRDTSKYASGYSEDQFWRVQLGMTAREVVDLLGPPLSIDPSVSPETWTYVIAPDAGRRSPLGGELSQIVFSGSGGVVSVSGSAARFIKAGAKRADVERLLGRPRWRTGPRTQVMHYSQPASHGVFHARIIELDKHSRVTNLTTYATSD